MGDAKNWGLSKERQSLREERARVESARRERGGAHNTGRPRGVPQRCASLRSSVKPHVPKRTGCDLGDQDVTQQRAEGPGVCAGTGTGQSSHGFGLAEP
jgi:hypothetical protein